MTVAAAADGTPLWWEALDGGDGTPVVLVQGLGYDADMWFRVTSHLTPDRRVVVLDNRGVGRSGVPEEPWSMADMAADVLTVAGAAGLERFHLVGFSMGGVIAQEVALAAPARLASLALVSTHPGGRDAARTSKDAAAMLTDRTARTRRESVERSVPFVYVDATPRDRVEEDLEVRMRRPLRARGYWGQWEAMRTHGGTAARLPSLTVPTLVVHGRQDALVNPDNARILHEAIPGSRLAWVDGASHLVMTDQEQRFADLLTSWLRSTD